MMEGGSGSLQTSRVTSNRCVNKGPTNLFVANVTTAPSITAISDSAQASLSTRSKEEGAKERVRSAKLPSHHT